MSATRKRDGGREEEKGNEGGKRVRPPVTINQRRSICSTLQADMHTHTRDDLGFTSALSPPPLSLSPVAFHAMGKPSLFRHEKPHIYCMEMYERTSWSGRQPARRRN